MSLLPHTNPQTRSRTTTLKSWKTSHLVHYLFGKHQQILFRFHNYVASGTSTEQTTPPKKSKIDKTVVTASDPPKKPKKGDNGSKTKWYPSPLAFGWSHERKMLAFKLIRLCMFTIPANETPLCYVIYQWSTKVVVEPNIPVLDDIDLMFSQLLFPLLLLISVSRFAVHLFCSRTLKDLIFS